MAVALTTKFSRNLALLREAGGLSKSELARRIWGTITDNRGYEVAKNRDRIGAWESGKAVPTADNILLLAKHFRIPASELAPDLMAQSAPDASLASVAIQTLDGDPGRVVLRVNIVLPAKVAYQIAGMIHEATTGEVA
jgi:transcriptional regulator with XRE-family HTH domain